MSILGLRLQALRKREGLSQEELAKRIESSQTMIGRYESGRINPPSDVIVRLAHHFGVTADYLLGLTDDPLGHIEKGDLSPLERRLISAFRQGEITEAFALAAELAKTKG